MARFAKRLLLTAFGLFIFAVGEFLTIQAGIGLSPWTCLSMGVSTHVPFSYGTVHVTISLLIVLVDVLLGEKIGFGTLLDALLVGTFVDMISALNLVPAITQPVLGAVVMCAGLMIMAFGQFVYMREGMGCGPRDSMTVGIGKRMSRVPIGAVEIGILALALAAGFLLGGPVGIGTIIATFGIGIAMQIVFNLLRFEPRDVVHESIAQTLARLSK